MAAQAKFRSLRFSTLEGVTSAVMVGCGETYVGALAVFLRATPFAIGLLAAVPLVMSAAVQLLVVALMRFISSRSAFLARIAAIQSFAWILVALIPLCLEGIPAVYLLFAVVVGYHALAGLILPVWSGLIGDLVPADVRGSYFGRRSMFANAATLMAMLSAGGLLAVYDQGASAAWGFTAIFFTAGVSRAISSYCFSRHADPPLTIRPQDNFSFLQFILKLPRSNFARFVLFHALITFSVWFAGPYFSVYMLRDMRLSYWEFSLILAAASATQILTVQYWGRISDRFGNKKILQSCSKVIVVLPLLWLFSARIEYLILVQFVAGFVWAGYNLSAANFVFDAVSPAKRGRCVAYQSVINGACILGGSLLGAWSAGIEGAAIHFDRWFAVPFSAYHTVFLLSGLLRALTVWFLLSFFHEVREVEPVEELDILFKVRNIRAFTKIGFSSLWFFSSSRESGTADSDSCIPTDEDISRGS